MVEVAAFAASGGLLPLVATIRSNRIFAARRKSLTTGREIDLHVLTLDVAQFL
jgi:hypothetical protein